MRIWYDLKRDLIIIEGVKQIFPPRSLVAGVVDNSKIIVSLANGDNKLTRILGPFAHSEITTYYGGRFNNIMDCLVYLVGVFNQGPDADLVGTFEQNL